MVVRIEHHRLACPQSQNRLADLRRRQPLAFLGPECGEQFAVRERGAQSVGRRVEFDGENQCCVRMLEDARPVTQVEFRRFDPRHFATASVEQLNPPEPRAHLDAVRADVLHRRRTGRARNPGQAFEAAQFRGDGLADYFVPHCARFGNDAVRVEAHGGVGHTNDNSVESRVRDHEIRSAGENQRRDLLAIEQRHDVDQRLRRRAFGEQPRRSPDSERRQSRQVNVLGHESA